VRLERARDLASLAQVGLSVAAVALGRGGSGWALGAAVVASAFAFARPRPAPGRAAARGWTLLVAVALVVSVVRAVSRLEFLDAGIDFLLLLVVQRMFNRGRCREHLQLLLLGAVLMIIGAVINADLSFPILLSAYLPVATLTLILNQLVAEGERLGPRVRAELARQRPDRLRALWRASLQVAALAGAAGLAVFVAFPRFGVGVFLRGSLPSGAISGFSDEVELGGFGRIKTDATVVMRMRPTTPLEREPRLVWHLRGSAFDLYDRGVWRRSGADGTREDVRGLESVQGFSVFRERGRPVAATIPDDGDPAGRARTIAPKEIPGFSHSTDGARMLVTLEDIGTELLFAASEPLGVRVSARAPWERSLQARVRDRGMRQIALLNRPPGPVQYEFVSRLGEPTREELAAVGDPAVPLAMRHYLQRPDDLSDDFRGRARDVAGGGRTRLAKVEAVLAHLGDFSYTLELTESARVAAGADPIEGFLLDTRAGHCEYFATAMALMLREVGVPTRNVNGYYGAHYNDVGDFYAVRQADAHSWVEVWFDGLGWITFDPTPPAGRTAGDGAPWWPVASAWLDALRNAYLEYVIDFDLGKQMELLTTVGLREGEASPRSRITLTVLAVPLGALVGGWLLVRWRRRPQTPAAARIYRSLLARLARAGWPRAADESATRFAGRLARARAPAAEPLARFCAEYERIRFGPTATPDALARLERLAAEVVAAHARGRR
jgi:transglutaminase-like putative cysteine protease